MSRMINVFVAIGVAVWACATLSSSGTAADFQTCSNLRTPYADVTGRWIAYVGPLDLKVTGDAVHGIYKGGDWEVRLNYTADRKFLVGVWDHLNGLVGPVIFFLDANGCIRHAKYGSSGAPACTPRDYSSCPHDWAIHGRMSSSR